MRGYGDIIAASNKTDTKEDQMRRAIGTQVSALGLEGVRVTTKNGHIQYVCRPRVDRELLLTRVSKLITHDGIRAWQEWLLKGGRMVVAVVLDMDLSEISSIIPLMRKVASSTVPDKKEIDIPIKLDHRPKSDFNLGNKSKSPGMAGAHPLGSLDV